MKVDLLCKAIRCISKSAIIVILLISFVHVANAAYFVENPEDLVTTGGVSATIRTYIDFVNEWSDPLMIRDPVTGLDSIVTTNGDDSYGILLIKYIRDENNNVIGWQFGGYADTDNIFNNYGLYPGSIRGSVYSNVFPEGSQVDQILPFYNGPTLGMGYVDNGVWTIGEDDIFYPGIEVDSTYPGELGFPTITYTQEVIINHPVILQEISEIPEPASILLLCSGLLSMIKFMWRKKHE